MFVGGRLRKRILGWRAAGIRAYGHEKATLLGGEREIGGDGDRATEEEAGRTRAQIANLAEELTCFSTGSGRALERTMHV